MEKIEKAAVIKALEVSDGELELINAQTLRTMTGEEVFTFKLAACNDQVDRDGERFSLSALEELAKLYVGKPVLSDHVWSAEKQTARVYAAGVEETAEGHRLILRCYMPRTERTKETIAAIESGLLRECSVGCAVGKATCSICGEDRLHRRCGHTPGREYDGRRCHIELSEAMDAYEVSLCAVPAQPGAGIVKRWEPEDGEDTSAGKPDLGERPEVQKALALLELEYKRF